jgi:heme exporter protein B
MRFFQAVATVALKDLRLELRTKDSINASLSFAVVILLLFSFAFDPASEATSEVAGGLLWIVFAFAGAIILNRTFARELTNDCLDVLISSPVPPAALFLGKALAGFLLLLGIELICIPIFGIFYSIKWWVQWPMLLLVVALATWAMTVIGTVFSALTVNLRMRELMLPMLLYPMMIPALMAAMQLTVVLMGTQPMQPDDYLWLRVVTGFDIIFTTLALGLVETILVR